MLRLRGRHVKTPPYMKRTNEMISSSLFPCISINGAAAEVRRAEWTEYIDPQNAVRTIRGCLKTADGSAHTVNPVQIQRNFAVDPGVPGGRMAETIAAVYSGTGVPPPSVEFLQPSWVGWSTQHFDKGGEQTHSRVYHVIPVSAPGTPVSNPGTTPDNYAETKVGYDTVGRLRLTTTSKRPFVAHP